MAANRWRIPCRYSARFNPTFENMDTRPGPRMRQCIRGAGPVYLTTAAVCPNSSLRSSSVRIAGWPKFGLTSFARA